MRARIGILSKHLANASQVWVVARRGGWSVGGGGGEGAGIGSLVNGLNT